MRRKLKPILALTAAVALLGACRDSPTASEIGPIPPLPAGATVITTASGLRYADITVGTGTTAQAGSRVSVNYTGWVASSGKGFDTTAGLNPYTFTLGGGGVISGFEEGVIGMKVGGKRRLFIPANLAYGATTVHDENGKVLIPANSDLVFDVELVAVQ
jgi:FKBP-type peptidyl-prolyl cis-trans isomerase FkpA